MFAYLILAELLFSLGAAVSLFVGRIDHATLYMVLTTWAVAQQVYELVRKGRK